MQDLVIFTLQASFLVHVSASAIIHQGPEEYEKYPKNCSSLEHFMNAAATDEISTYLTSLNISGAWLPIKRRWLNNWVWVDGNIYGETMPHPGWTNKGYNCALLRAGDRIIVDAACSRTLSLVICDTRDVSCPDITDAYRCCFTLHQKTYVAFSGGKITWYMAKVLCYQKNMTLASFPAKDRNLIMEQLSLELGLYEKVWIGLHKVEYLADPSQSVVNWFNWAEASPCVCPEKDCVLVIKNGSWVAETCTSMHVYLCHIDNKSDILERPTRNTTLLGVNTTVKPNSKSINVAAILVPVLLTGVFIGIIILLLIWKRKDLPHYRAKGRDEGVPLLQNSMDIKQRISSLKLPYLNILVLGLRGTGKTCLSKSLLKTLQKECPENQDAVSSTGIEGTIQKHSYDIISKQIEGSAKETEQNENRCLVTIWECPNLQNEDTQRIEDLITLILNGELKEDVAIDDYLLNRSNLEDVKCDATPEKKINAILMVFAAKWKIPSNLVNCILKTVKKNGVPVIWVISMKDAVTERKLNTTVRELTDKLHELRDKLDLKNAESILTVTSYTSETMKKEKKIEGEIHKLWEAILDEKRKM